MHPDLIYIVDYYLPGVVVCGLIESLVLTFALSNPKSMIGKFATSLWLVASTYPFVLFVAAPLFARIFSRDIWFELGWACFCGIVLQILLHRYAHRENRSKTRRDFIAIAIATIVAWPPAMALGYLGLCLATKSHGAPLMGVH